MKAFLGDPGQSPTTRLPTPRQMRPHCRPRVPSTELKVSELLLEWRVALSVGCLVLFSSLQRTPSLIPIDGSTEVGTCMYRTDMLFDIARNHTAPTGNKSREGLGKTLKGQLQKGAVHEDYLQACRVAVVYRGMFEGTSEA
jgi:hypothetical protein